MTRWTSLLKEAAGVARRWRGPAVQARAGNAGTAATRRSEFFRAVVLALVLVAPTSALHAQGHPDTKLADAKPGDLRIFATGSIGNVLEAAAPELRKRLHRDVVVQYGAARGDLKKAILAGEAFEVAVLLPDVNDAAAQAGKVQPDLYELARVPAGMGLRGDVPSPDISTPAALKTALLGAKSLIYYPQGAGALTAHKIIDELGIAAQVHDNSTAREPIPLGPGEYELHIFPLSEILAKKALRNLGPVIAELSVPVILEASIGRNANDPKAALAVIEFLQGPALDASLRANGIVRSSGRRSAVTR